MMGSAWLGYAWEVGLVSSATAASSSCASSAAEGSRWWGCGDKPPPPMGVKGPMGSAMGDGWEVVIPGLWVLVIGLWVLGGSSKREGGSIWV